MRLNYLATLSTAALIGCQAEAFTSPGPSTIEVVSGPPAVVSLTTTLDTPVVIRVVDMDGAPRAGVPVTWQVVEGDGKVLEADAVTDESGTASAQWRFGSIPGAQRMLAQVEGLDPAILTTEARGLELVQVTAGYGHACGIDSLGAAWCWGGDQIEMGGASAVDPYRPVQVAGGHRFEEVQAGDSFTCGRTSTGEVWCWGHNFGYALGTPGLQYSGIPLLVNGLPAATRLRSGASHACAITVDRSTWCWGTISGGWTPGGTPGAPATPVATGLGFEDLALGSRHTCGRTTSGVVYCWGTNEVGQLGDSGSARTAPTTPVLGGLSFAEVRSGDHASCARTFDGEVWCWGDDGVLAATSTAPARLDVPPASGLAVAFSFIATHHVAGEVRFQYPPPWQLELPATIRGLGVTALTGRGSYCLLTAGGGVYCSGSAIDGGNWTSLPPFGCAPDGPVPLPTGGKVVECYDRWED